jgi:ubiquinone/menaquinone biosynthesis C-methylase UbiE
MPDVEMLLALSHMFDVTVNEILEGNDAIRRIANRPYETDGIACFVPREEREYNAEWAKSIVRDGWVKRNWENRKRDPAWGAEPAHRIVRHGGLTLEIGTGPGGGYVPPVLMQKSDARIILSDLSPTVVREWKRLFEAEFYPPNVMYAALDNCDLPFQDDSIDVVSAGGGFGNTEGDQFKALREIYRVLKPGGLYVVGDGFVTQDTLKAFPEKIQRELMIRRPDIFEDYHAASVAAGFKKIDNVIAGGWSTKNDESLMADLARELGIEIWFTAYIRYCVK